MNEPLGRSQIVQTVSAQLVGTVRLQSLTEKSSSDQKSQTLFGQSKIVQTASGQLAPDAIGALAAENAEVLQTIRGLL